MLPLQAFEVIKVTADLLIQIKRPLKKRKIDNLGGLTVLETQNTSEGIAVTLLVHFLQNAQVNETKKQQFIEFIDSVYESYILPSFASQGCKIPALQLHIVNLQLSREYFKHEFDLDFVSECEGDQGLLVVQMGLFMLDRYIQTNNPIPQNLNEMIKFIVEFQHESKLDIIGPHLWTLCHLYEDVQPIVDDLIKNPQSLQTLGWICEIPRIRTLFFKSFVSRLRKNLPSGISKLLKPLLKSDMKKWNETRDQRIACQGEPIDHVDLRWLETLPAVYFNDLEKEHIQWICYLLRKSGVDTNDLILKFMKSRLVLFYDFDMLKIWDARVFKVVVKKLFEGRDGLLKDSPVTFWDYFKSLCKYVKSDQELLMILWEAALKMKKRNDKLIKKLDKLAKSTLELGNSRLTNLVLSYHEQTDPSKIPAIVKDCDDIFVKMSWDTVDFDQVLPQFWKQLDEDVIKSVIQKSSLEVYTSIINTHLEYLQSSNQENKNECLECLYWVIKATPHSSYKLSLRPKWSLLFTLTEYPKLIDYILKDKVFKSNQAFELSTAQISLIIKPDFDVLLALIKYHREAVLSLIHLFTAHILKLSESRSVLRILNELVKGDKESLKPFSKYVPFILVRFLVLGKEDEVLCLLDAVDSYGRGVVFNGLVGKFTAFRDVFQDIYLRWEKERRYKGVS